MRRSVLIVVLMGGWVMVSCSQEHPFQGRPHASSPPEQPLKSGSSQVLRGPSTAAPDMVDRQTETPPRRPFHSQTKKKKASLTQFAGADACQPCHAEIYDNWKNSTHGRAGDHVHKNVSIPERRSFEFSDITVELKEQGTQLAFELSRRRGSNTKVLERVKVDGVVGRNALMGGGAQAYFHRTSEGLVVHLPFEYAPTIEKWLCQKRISKDSSYGKRATHSWVVIDGTFKLSECGWPPKRTLGFTNQYNCGNCHGSQIDVRFSPEHRRFETKYTSLGINCESCHGAGQRHVDVMTSTDRPDLIDIGLDSQVLATKAKSMEVCLACHATKGLIQPGYLSGDEFHDYFTLLSMGDHRNAVVFPDGRISDFGYQEGHLYSDCYLNGSMTCVDCHDPHSNGYRDVHGRALKGRFDDGQCTGCHPSKGPSHTRHANVRCTDCHMPFHQHPAVEPVFPMRRSDHAIPIPRPGHDERQGTQNACGRCHQERGLKWQKNAHQRLYGSIKPQPKLLRVLDQARREQLDSVDKILDALKGGSGEVPIRAVFGLSHVAEAFAAGRINHISNQGIEQLKRLTHSETLDVRAAALTTLLVLAPLQPSLAEYCWTHIERDNIRAFQLRLKIQHNLISLFRAFELARSGGTGRLRSALELALPILNIDPTRVAGLWGDIYRAEGDMHAAVAQYLKAARHSKLNGRAHTLGSGGGASYQFWLNAGDAFMASGQRLMP